MIQPQPTTPLSTNVTVKQTVDGFLFSLFVGLSAGSAATSPLKSVGGFFQKKQEDESWQKSRPLKRSKTDPTMSKSRKFPYSLKKGSKKDKDKDKSRTNVTEGPSEEKLEEKEEMEDLAEIDEMYTLPEIPHTPLSVMQISKLIEMEVLEEAHLNLLALRLEFQQELQHCGQDSPMDLVKKEKDLNLLYRDLRNKITTIVRDSNSFPCRNKGLLVLVARIIQEEEKRAEEAGGLAGSWMEAWRDAVDEGVRAKVESVHLEQREQNAAWLSVHLGLLGKAIVDDLASVKTELRWSYPPSFRVFSTYVRGYHRVVAQHLRKLEQQVTELKDLFALLDWIVNRYKSERIMANVSLQPEMREESSDLQLDEHFLEQLRDKYCNRVKVDVRFSLDRVIELENEVVWTKQKMWEQDGDDDVLDAPFHRDIFTRVDGIVKNAPQIDAQLEKRVITSCLEELKLFPKRFESEFMRQCSSLRPRPPWTNYHITYINGFTALQQHLEGYARVCPGEMENFRKEVKWLIARLTQRLEDQFKEDVKPFLRRMMTRKWLTNSDDFDQLYERTEALGEHCALMRPQHVQAFASHLHYHVLREYIGQLMKNNYSCKNRKHEKAAAKIRQQWENLVDVFRERKHGNSLKTLSHEWMYPVGDDLCNIIGQKKKADIKEHLEPMVKRYPDFSKKHLVAVLNFRGLLRGRERQLILRRFTELKNNNVGGAGAAYRDQSLFGDMQVSVNTDCLSSLPLSCLGFLLPDS
ncbi:exocyst complex component 3 4 [Solea senegalensis]|uniref:Exocyst complex component 3 4 n=1 Tax=Solea senegalensis TaxID=28829 RepID=A0AAV6S1H1_SOLSE|nr:exocyst complex component 3 4 [Solea senegalensis]